MTTTADLLTPVSPAPRRPHRSLRGLVDNYHGYHYVVPEPGVHRGLPSSVMTVVLALDEPLDVGWLDRPDSRGTHWAIASGLHTAPAEIYHQGVQCGIQLGLTAAGARALLGLPMGSLAAEIVSLDSLIPTALSRVHARLSEQLDWEARYDLLDRVLIEHVGHLDVSAVVRPRAELMRTWQQIGASGGSASVSSLAAEVGWSRRHLAAQFRAEFGLSPKGLARVARFGRSRARVASGRRLAEVAADCGFSDQAHLTREWRAMSGYTPLQWRREEFPFVQDLAEDDLRE